MRGGRASLSGPGSGLSFPCPPVPPAAAAKEAREEGTEEGAARWRRRGGGRRRGRSRGRGRGGGGKGRCRGPRVSGSRCRQSERQRLSPSNRRRRWLRWLHALGRGRHQQAVEGRVSDTCPPIVPQLLAPPLRRRLLDEVRHGRLEVEGEAVREARRGEVVVARGEGRRRRLTAVPSASSSSSSCDAQGAPGGGSRVAAAVFTSHAAASPAAASSPHAAAAIRAGPRQPW